MREATSSMKRKTLFVLGLVSVSSLLLTGAARAATNVIKPVLDFEFNEGKGPTTTDSVAKIVGTLGYAPPVVITTNAPSGATNDNSIGFNLGVLGTNNSCLVVDDSSSPILAFATNAPFTMQAWVNRATNDTTTYEGIGGYGFSYKMGLGNTGEFVFTLFGIVDLYSGYYPPPGEWHHLAAAWTPGTGVALYHDGILITNLAETGVPRAYQFNTLSIGAEQPGNTAFHGLIDRFRIDKTALDVTNLDSNATNPAPVTTNTVVAYTFDQSAYPFPSSGATARPAVPYDTTGPTFVTDTPSGLAGDYALNFAAGQQVVVPDPKTVMQLDTNNPSFTLQSWVKLTGNPTNREVLFYANGPGGAVSFSVYTNYYTVSTNTVTNRTVFVTTLGIADVNSKAAIPSDTNWHHIAVVHQNGSNLLFYVDGALADTVAYTNGVIFTRTNQVFYIGSEAGNNLQYLGKLDRLRVTSGILAPADLDYRAVPGPELVLAGSVDSGVGITFDRPVDPTTATNPANYTVTGATVESVTIFEGQYVALQLAGVPGTAVKVTVTGVKDLAGNPVNGTASTTGQFGTLNLVSADIGTPGVDPLQPGFAAALGEDGYLVGAGGSDIYNNTDGFHFLYTPFSGAFDVRVRVEWMNPIGTGDPWAKAGLMIRETLDAGSRNVHFQATRSDGENGVYETWRDVANNATVSTPVLEGPPEPYPNVWLRLVRPDPTTNLFLAYYSTNGGAWVYATNHTIPGAVLPNRVYVGMDVTEHNNTATVPLALAVFKQFSLDPYPSVVEAARTYGLGFKFGADAGTTATTKMQPGDVAGVPGVAQANWNNVNGASGTNTNNIVGDLADDTASSTKVEIIYTSNGTWASTGEGEENNQFPVGPDRALMTGYLDTGAPTTTSVTISNLPTQLTGSANGYDLYVYYTGGTDNDRYGGYRVLDAVSGAVLKDYVVLACSSNATGFIEAPGGTNRPPLAKGNYFIFSGLTATNITVQATTVAPYGGGGTPRAPLNALQLVAPSSAVPPPAVPYQLGQTVNGFQDDFSGPVRNPDWLAVSGSTVGLGSDHYQQLNGVLYVTTLTNDPNHLIYVGPGGSNTTQEVLARIRVIQFGSGDPSRGGVGACVSSNVTGKTGSWIGYNLNLRNNLENFNGVTNTVHFKMLDDLRSWGPQTTYGWTKDTWYWERLKVDPTKPDGTNIVFAKTWPADGVTPEPAAWALTWSNPPTPVHGGFGGITGSSAGGLSEFEVSYVLIKCATLPPITVDFSIAPLPNAYVRSVSPANGATSVAPNGEVQAVLVDGQYPINPNSITMMLNGSPVKVDVSKVGDVATITYVPDGIYAPNDTINVTLGYVENGDAVVYHWSFSAAPYTRDVLHGYIGTLEGPAFFSPSGGGHTGKPGDYAINFGESGSGTAVYVADASFLNLAAANDVMSISLWIKRYTTNDVQSGSSAFWCTSPSSSSSERGFQAHAPWSDDNIYFDTDGCCGATTERINASITTFAPYKAVSNDTFWTSWHNFVFVKNTTNKFIYIDGVLFLKGTNTAALPQDFINLYMGSEDSTNNDLKGMIDDFAVYSSAVSAADAALLASGTPPTDLAGETLLAYWNFDDAADSSQRAYSIGLHFGADEFSGNNASTLASTAIAGVPSVMQANWNNLKTLAGTNVTGIVSDYADNTSSTTLVSVSWSSPNTWSTLGRGETNNSFPAGPDQQLMLGYLDTVSSGTTTVTISNLPSALTANGYSAYVYAMGSVVGRSGGYRIVDAGTGAILTGYKFVTATSNMFNYVQAPLSSNPEAPGVGNYMVFSGLTASNIQVQATTANGLGGSATPRAPMEAIQLVVSPAAYGPPAGLAVSISVTPSGLVLTFTGTLQSADQISGPWTDVPGTSPMTITPSAGMKFYRVRN